MHEPWASKKLLDHGFIHLVDTMPHFHHEPDGTSELKACDARIVSAARVSMGHLSYAMQMELGLDPTKEEERTTLQDVKLIQYLMKNGHTSPFEKVRLEFVVKLPIFIARQWIRHRTGSFNEVSARYSQLPNEFYVPEFGRMQAQSTSNKQASAGRLDGVSANLCLDDIDVISRAAYERYEHMLSLGLARELARMVLPTNFYTQWYWTVDLHNLFHFLKLRLHPHAQYEIRVYAEAILEMLERIAPVATEAFKKFLLGHEPERTIRAEGKVAALIEWANGKHALEQHITAGDVLDRIEEMFAVDKK